MITDLCHYVDASDTYTKLVLTRDSFGRKGIPQKGKVDVQNLSEEDREFFAGKIVEDNLGGESFVFDQQTHDALEALEDI